MLDLERIHFSTDTKIQIEESQKDSLSFEEL